MPSLKRILPLIVLTLPLLFLGHFWSQWTNTDPADRYVLITVVLFFMTLIPVRFLLKPLDPQVFVSVFLMTLVGKILFYLCFLFLLVYLSPEHLWSNVVFSFIGYVVYMVAETVLLFRLKTRS